MNSEPPWSTAAPPNGSAEKRAGYPVRAGHSVWRPFEAQTPQTQERTLEASAIAMHLLETGDLTGRGDAAALFLPEPDVPLDPDPPRQTHRSLEDRWRELADAVKAAIEDAKQNPNSASQLFDLMTMYPRGDAATHNQRIRANFEELGIPLDFLSQ